MEEPKQITLTIADFEILSAGKPIEIGKTKITFEDNVTLLKLIHVCEWHLHNECKKPKPTQLITLK